MFSSVGKGDVTPPLLWFQLPSPSARMVLRAVSLSLQLCNRQQVGRIFPQQSPVLSAGCLLLTTHVPQLRSFLAGLLFYIYYQLLFLSFKLKHFFLVMRCFLCINLLYHLVPPSALLSSVLAPLVPENAGAVKPHSAWQHHFYLQLHVIIIDLEV